MAYYRRFRTQWQAAAGERGVALLIAIFSLLLISGVAISLITMSGTETAMNANYKRNTTVFYAAVAGLEEARARLVANIPETLRTNPKMPNEALPVAGQVLYVVNPGPTDPAFNPMTSPPTSPYYDSEYKNEFKTPPADTTATAAPASYATAGNIPPTAYKWVRVTLKTEAMTGVDLNGDGVMDNILPVRVDGAGHQCITNTPGCLIPDPANLPPVGTAAVYRVTSFAMESNGARRLVQAEFAELPPVNPDGAIASKAGVKVSGNFNAFGGWPPIVQATCGSGPGKQTIPTCGSFAKGAVQGDCNNPYNKADDTCGIAPNKVPRSHKDYCNQGAAANGVTSGGDITTSGTYTMVPDSSGGCSPTSSGCVYTVDPKKALDPSVKDWPYDMDQLIQTFRPPATEPVQNVKGIACAAYDQSGNRKCSGQGVQMGTLPSTWPPPPNVPQLDNQPRYVFADTGPGGLLKLTGASSGSGILVVEGDLVVEAGFQWYGLVIVRGVVTFLGGGATPTNIFGGVLAGTSVTNANTTTGGSVSVTYSSCAYKFSGKDLPLRYLSFREITQ